MFLYNPDDILPDILERSTIYRILAGLFRFRRTVPWSLSYMYKDKLGPSIGPAPLGTFRAPLL